MASLTSNRRMEIMEISWRNPMKPIALLLTILLFATTAFAEVKTYTHTIKQPFGGSYSPDDARVATITRAKRECLKMAGTYLESLTVVKDYMVEKDEILALAAGVLKAEIVSEERYATKDTFGIIVKAKVDVDTSILEERVKKFFQDKTLLEKYKKSQECEKELLARIEKLEKQNQKLKAMASQATEQEKLELKQKFQETAQGLTAVEWNRKALDLWVSGKYTNPGQALEYLNQAIRLDPKDALAYNNRGVAYADLGQYQRAIEDFNQAIRLDPKDALAYSNRGAAYCLLGNIKQAIKDFDRAIELNPLYAHAYCGRGVAYDELGNGKQAIKDYGSAIELDPQDAKAYYSRGLAYGDLGNMKQAIKDFDKAIELNPLYAHAYYNRGVAYDKLGNGKQTIKNFKIAARLGHKGSQDFLRSMGIQW